MALTRRAFLPLCVGLAGCAGLSNRAPELGIENRSGSEQHVVAFVERLDGTGTTATSGTPVPVYEGTVPPGSRVLRQDVAATPPEGGSIDVAVEVETGSYGGSEELTVTGPGTIDVRITRNGIRIFFAAKD